jgi:hypothetical protein
MTVAVRAVGVDIDDRRHGAERCSFRRQQKVVIVYDPGRRIIDGLQIANAGVADIITRAQTAGARLFRYAGDHGGYRSIQRGRWSPTAVAGLGVADLKGPLDRHRVVQGRAKGMTWNVP